MVDTPGDFKFLTVTLHGDGSFTRHPYDPPLLPASPSPLQPVRSKDVTLNSSHGTWARLFLPTSFTSDSHPHKSNSVDDETNKKQDINAQDDEVEEEEKKKLPLLLYFHGGGFLYGSPAVPIDHAFMCTLASHAGILIVSVEYRLAPEHRLPCAYDDGVEALQWLCAQADALASSASAVDPWLARHADFSRLYVAGDSAGANITHQVVSRAAKLGLGLGLGQENRYSCVCLRGFILIHPFFTLVEGSRCNPEFLVLTKRIWGACLPVGSDAGKHPFVNPMADEGFGTVAAGLPRALVLVASEDGLFETGVAYAEALQGAGKADVKLFVSHNEGHVFHLLNPASQNLPAFLSELSSFMHQN